MTFTDLMRQSALALGHLRAGTGLNASELADGLKIANNMILASNTNSANIFTRRLDQYAMVANKQAYTIGDASGTLTDLAGARPQRIEQDGVNLFMATDLRRPIRLVDDTEWAAIRLQKIYTYPNRLYYDGANYDGTAIPIQAPKLYFYPIPAAAYQWEMYTWQANAVLATVTTLVSFPPGYEEFWIYNLALRIAPMLRCQISTDVRELARQATANVQSMNVTSPLLKTDPSLSGKRGGWFNWMSRETY